MDNVGRTLMSILLLSLVLIPVRSFAQSPAGRWRTFDDKTGKERGLMVIEEHGGELTGRIGGILDPVEAARMCEKCTDARRGQPVLGMTVMTGMRQDGNKWDGGEILDPETGSTYHCTIRVEDGGAKLNVRGYIGLPLFGRSQTWVRAH